MVFYPPPWVPKLPFGKSAVSPAPLRVWFLYRLPDSARHATNVNPDPPDSVTIGEFMNSDAYGRFPISKSRNPFTCGLTGKTYTTKESHERSEQLAKALSKIMGWAPNRDSPWDKVIGLFSVNTVCDLNAPKRASATGPGPDSRKASGPGYSQSHQEEIMALPRR